MDFEISLQVNAVAAVVADPAASYLAHGHLCKGLRVPRNTMVG